MREIKFRYKIKGRTKLLYDTDEEFAYLSRHNTIATLHGNILFVEDRQEYTGLKDKNGVESYYKDITDDGGRRFIVEWLDDRAQFVLVPIGASRALALPMECLKDMEVIGNIYESPHL